MMKPRTVIGRNVMVARGRCDGECNAYENGSKCVGDKGGKISV